MTRKSLEEKLKDLEARKNALEYKLKSKKAMIEKERRRALSLINEKKRKEDSRKKILIGAAMLHQVEIGRVAKDRLYKILSDFVRDDDLVLFDDLKPKIENEEVSQ